MKARPRAFSERVAVLLLSGALVLGGCGAQAASSSDVSATQESAGSPNADDYESVFKPTSIVSRFIGEKFSDQKVTDEESALAVIKSVYDRIGADDTTELEVTAIRPTETGTTYYVFNQVAGDVLVHGASVKLITNKDNEPIALVSAILPQVKLARSETWEITEAQAEEAVVKECEKNGNTGVKPVAGATERALVPVPDREENMQFAWVVYTPNYDTSSEMPYLAHYVDANGSYLYALPINEPHNADAEKGDRANFDFGKYEQSTWTGTLTLHDGTTKEAEVPVLVDPSDNSVILGDAQRKILCADYAKWKYEETLAPRVSTESSFDNVELLAYETFIQVWDFYDSIGWTAPDGEGTPTLLLMDYVDKNGEPQDQAFYSGRKNGFQTFAFNRLNPDGENMDIIAHEFSHCITSTTMTTNLYLNEMGAINEGMSDVLGNLVEMLVANKPESAWLLGDSSGGGTLRSMKDPHEFMQPAFRWDTYYTPDVVEGTETNDQGGVHINSSMLNIVSYRLDQAGMTPADQLYFWMNVALAMTPQTDYAQMAELLPWCMEESGFAQHEEALSKAIAESGYATLEEPETLPAGTGKVTLTFDAPELIEKGVVRFAMVPVDSEELIMTWPVVDSHKVSFTLPVGDYLCQAQLGSEEPRDCSTYSYHNESWQLVKSDEYEMSPVHVEEGKTVELSAEGLPTTADAVGK